MVEEAVAEAPARKRRYRVIAGQHWARNPAYNPSTNEGRDRRKSHVLYKQGDVIESEENLAQKYDGKFELIPEMPQVEVTAERRQAAKALIDSGSWTQEDKEFLETMPPDNFQRVMRNAMQGGKTPPPMESEPPPTGKKASTLGENITAKFQVAYDEGFQVWVNLAGKHQVTMGNSKKPINPEPLAEEEVDKWVMAYLKEKRGGG
jgi:hypothetical protein